jgi:hypothetical protein
MVEIERRKKLFACKSKRCYEGNFLEEHVGVRERQHIGKRIGELKAVY